LLRSVNAELATLAGCELLVEYDVSPAVNVFGSLAYTDGRDREIDVPLAAIAPLESRLGIRVHDDTEEDRWAWEFGTRIVDNQDRLAAFRAANFPGVVQLEEPTPGFTVFYLRGNLRLGDRMNMVAGIDNLLDR